MKDQHIHKQALQNAPFGYVRHKVTARKNGKVEDLVFLEINKAFEKITGLKAEQVINRKLSESIPGLFADKLNWMDLHDKVDAMDKPAQLTVFSDHFNKWFKVQTYSLEKDHYISTFIDATAEMQQTANLEEVSTRLKAIMEVMPDMIFVLSREGIYRDAYAPEPSKLFWPKDQILGKTIHELFPAEEANEHIRLYQKCIRENCTQVINYSLEKAGVKSFFEARIVRLNDDEILAIIRDITDSTYSERALVESVEKYKQLVEDINDVIFALGEDGVVTYMSPAVTRITEIPASSYLGQHFATFIHPDDRKIVERSFIDLKNGIESSTEYRITKKSGEMVWVRSSSRAIKKEDHTIEFRGVAQDITEHKIAEKYLKDSEERFRALHNASFGGIALHDKGLILECNHGLSVVTGYSQDELIGMNGLLLISEKTRDYVVEKILSGYEKPYEAIGITKSGKEYPVHIEAKNIPYKGKMIRVTEFRDISEQKKSEITQQVLYSIASYMLRARSLEDLLEHSRNELSKLVDTTNFFMATYHPDTDMLKRVVFKDEKDDFIEWQAGDTFSGKVVKQARSMLINRQDVEKYAADNGLTIKGSIPECWLGVPLTINNVSVGVIVIQSYDDPEAYDQRSASLLEMVARELALFLDRARMLQDLKEAKEKAEESDRLKSAFLANMSHEIRTPMNGILGFAELLKEPNLEGAKQRKFISIIEKSGQRMLNLINDLMDISKIEAGQMEVYKVNTKINELIYFAYDFFKPEFENKNIYLTFKMPDNEYVVRTDREKIDAILTNLLKNAVKYTEKGTVSFGFTEKEGFLEFFVKDTGIGIPAYRIETIFDRFVQVESDNYTPYEGAGLGLAIVKAYVEMLGGQIWVESENGVGSIFRFTIPLSIPPM